MMCMYKCVYNDKLFCKRESRASGEARLHMIQQEEGLAICFLSHAQLVDELYQKSQETNWKEKQQAVLCTPDQRDQTN